MKNIAIIAALVLAACTNDTGNPPPDDVGEFVVEMCGDAPVRPAWNVAREQVNGYDRVLMTPEIYAEIEAWRYEVEAWGDCVTGL